MADSSGHRSIGQGVNDQFNHRRRLWGAARAGPQELRNACSFISYCHHFFPPSIVWYALQYFWEVYTSEFNCHRSNSRVQMQPCKKRHINSRSARKWYFQQKPMTESASRRKRASHQLNRPSRNRFNNLFWSHAQIHSRSTLTAEAKTVTRRVGYRES